MGNLFNKTNKIHSSESRLVEVVTDAYNNPRKFYTCNDSPSAKQAIDNQLKINPGYILASHKSVIYGNWAHTGIFQNWNCFFLNTDYKRRVNKNYKIDNDYFPEDRISFSVNHAAYPKSLTTVSFLRPIGEINSLGEKEQITPFRDSNGENYYDRYPRLDNKLTIRVISLKENLSIGLTKDKISRIEFGIYTLSNYFVENGLKYGGLCKLGKRCSELLPQNLKQLLTQQLNQMENIKEAELICSSFALLTYQLVLFITGNLDILTKVLPFNSEACLPRNVANLHKNLPQYWNSNTYVFGCSTCNPISFD